MRSVTVDARAYGAARVSAQRRAIAAAVTALAGAFTVDELAAALRRRRGRAGVATVYRAVAALEASRWLERIGQRDGSALFARCAEGMRHHHHVVCGDCGRVAVIRCPGVGKTTRSGRRQGFLITRHEVTLHGLCADCRPSHNAEAKHVAHSHP
jgi:Fur family transcriptional regulator, ferric uptake regulator